MDPDLFSSIEVAPLEMYDSARAKIDANLRWLFAKAYGIGELFSTNTVHLMRTHTHTHTHTRGFRHDVDTL